MYFNNKAIGPLIASALLLVVAIVAVISFQTWFNTYSSNIFSGVETQSGDSVSSSNIDTIINGNLYFKNSGTSNITVNSIKVGSVDCNVSQSLAPGVSSIDVSSCVNGTSGSNEVVVITNQKVFSKKLYFENPSSISSTSPSLSFSSNSSSVNISGNVTLTWSSSNVDTCIGYNDWSGSKGTSGSESIQIIENSTFYINCSGSSGTINSSLDIQYIEEVISYSDQVHFAKYPSDIETGDSGPYTAGGFDSSGNYYVYFGLNNDQDFGNNITLSNSDGQAGVIKYNKDGDAQWAKAINPIGGNLNRQIDAVADSSGNLYVYGLMNSNVIVDIGGGYNYTAGPYGGFYIAKYDTSGNPVYINGGNKSVSGTINAAQSYSIATDSQGNVYIAGTYYDLNLSIGPGIEIPTSTNSPDIFLIKYNTTGEVEWYNSHYGSSGNVGDEYQHGIAADNNSNVYFIGRLTQGTGTYDFGNSVTLAYAGGSSTRYFLVEYNSSGDAQWVKYPTTSTSQFNSIDLDLNDGSYYIGGYNGAGTVTIEGNSVETTRNYLLKYNSSDSVQWIRNMNNSAAILLQDAVKGGEDLYVTGYHQSGNMSLADGINTTFTTKTHSSGYNDFFIIKFNDSNGDAIWTREDYNFTGGGDDRGIRLGIINNQRLGLIGYTDRNISLSESIHVNLSQTPGTNNGNYFIASYAR